MIIVLHPHHILYGRDPACVLPRISRHLDQFGLVSRSVGRGNPSFHIHSTPTNDRCAAKTTIICVCLQQAASIVLCEKATNEASSTTPPLPLPTFLNYLKRRCPFESKVNPQFQSWLAPPMTLPPPLLLHHHC